MRVGGQELHCFRLLEIQINFDGMSRVESNGQDAVVDAALSNPPDISDRWMPGTSVFWVV